MIIEGAMKALIISLDKIFEPTILTAVEAMKMRGYIKLNFNTFKLLKRVKNKKS